MPNTLEITKTTAATAIILLGLVFSATARADDGEALFQQHCAACHGKDGRGGVGVPLALPAFIDSVDDRYLRESIRLGRPGRVMPAFGYLGEKKIDALVDHMRSWTGKRVAAFPTATVKGNAVKGAKLYATYCTACHGANGEGSKGTGVTFSRPRNLPVLAPALNNSGFLASATDAMIKNTLIKGRQGSPMVSFTKSAGLNEQDIDNLVAHVRSFPGKVRPEITAANAGPLVIERDSPYDFKTTVNNIKNALPSYNLVLIREQALDQGLANKGKENKNQTIIYSCGFHMLNEALKVDPRVGLFLPCRITIVQLADKVKVMAVNPKRMSALFNNEELDRLCDRMRQTYTDLMEEALL